MYCSLIDIIWRQNEYFAAFKQSRRRDDDISIVNSAMKVQFFPETIQVKSIHLAFGGMGATIQMAKDTMKVFQN